MTQAGEAWYNVARHLPAQAAQRPGTPAVVASRGRDPDGRRVYTVRTFSELNRESDRLARALASVGVERGMRVALMVPPSLEFFALTFALFKLGAVLVLIDPGMGVRNLGRCLDEAAPEAFLGVLRAQMARKLLGWARASARITVGVGTRVGARHALTALRRAVEASPWEVADVAAEEMAAILFTSGSTGVAKGAIYTHGMFTAQVEVLRRQYGIVPGEVDLATFPLFALFAPALGMTAIIPRMDATRPARVDPREIIEPVRDWRVTNMFGSPALLNTVSRWAASRDVRLPSLRRVISAGAPVPAAVIERTARLLSAEARVHTPYGATECLPVSSIDSAMILGETRARTEAGQGVCVGSPVEGLDVAIIPISEEPITRWEESLRLPEGVIGEIAVRGPCASRGYFGRPEADRLAKISTADGGFWHRMGDVGYRDARGRLWFCGRKAHRVSTRAGTLFTIPCEGIFNTHPAVFRSALVGVGLRGEQIPVVCVELEKNVRRGERSRIFEELRVLAERFEITRTLRHFLAHPGFPVDIRHNAKIDRERLARWAARRVRI